MFLFKRSNNIYYVVYTTGSKRKYVSTHTTRKSEALKFLSGFNPDKQTPKPTNLKLSELRTEIMKYVSVNLRPSNVGLYKLAFKEFLNVVGDKSIPQITFKDFEHFKEVRMKDIKPSTINIRLVTLKTIFNLAVTFGHLQSSPGKDVKKIKVSEKPIRAFTPEQIELILNNIENAKIRRFCCFAYLSGLRLSEILNLKWENIDFEGGIIRVENSKDFEIKTGKLREIPISDKIYNLLTEITNEAKRGNVIPLNQSRFVFVSSRNYKYSLNTVSKYFKATLRMLNFPEHFSFHSLRHSHATTLINKGVSPFYVQKLLGHSNLKTTERYVHANLSDLKKSISQI